jgi:hypothetical protein
MTLRIKAYPIHRANPNGKPNNQLPQALGSQQKA